MPRKLRNPERGKAVTTDEIKSFLKVRLFEPFDIRKTSGETHRVVSPESISFPPKRDLVMVYPPDVSLVLFHVRLISAVFYPPKKASKGAK
jgi:hypothetical protein